ncbi:AAA domain-containing protein [Pseudomonas aeruginosa]|nr:AAA domain-containing protein [Pseudomonas aeruginosa]
MALDAALNTPDLAIIIGPPGTGKTQVIAALQRRLAEEAEERNIAAQVLISSFQHDAVDNALDRSDVFGLPGARVGGKRSASDEASLIDPWLERHVAHLQEKLPRSTASTRNWSASGICRPDWRWLELSAHRQLNKWKCSTAFWTDCEAWSKAVWYCRPGWKVSLRTISSN